mmetsp:Transcript_30051/g.36491  ORF Transcript_30051/g.36491 Transcript_30051/m.36491 type:complete len:370 (+) Transcript_30051:263-1372(+)|eukprot:CAMPEP_0197852366 /NCGR_PEP_ID=MMETSP1438-20131217/20400_1 /TAXON_ID=1461541 /ORGANISM="Pterosperma sp., Strain CCMP1384" /LENGTH=369 /DNA_ID=CAMNT_0043466379 /DNA_START=229 /DNA_END=1338 /DNA_ORIENTATION=-
MPFVGSLSGLRSTSATAKSLRVSCAEALTPPYHVNQASVSCQQTVGNPSTAAPGRRLVIVAVKSALTKSTTATATGSGLGRGYHKASRIECSSGGFRRGRQERSRETTTTCCEATKGEGGLEESKGKLLVLGGTGFVGSTICELAVAMGYEVVAVSRRGKPADVQYKVDWRAGDVIQNPELITEILQEGGFVGAVHAIGMLLDNDLNKIASGSGSVPTPGTTYDQVTRETAFSAAAALAEISSPTSPLPLVFVSAAEAGWDPDPPFTPPFLTKYLIAKRAVEAELMDKYQAEGLLRPIILRPSLVWTPERLPSVPAVAAFYLGNLLKIPGIDRPVQVGVLARAALVAIRESDVSGVQNYESMEGLAARA